MKYFVLSTLVLLILLGLLYVGVISKNTNLFSISNSNVTKNIPIKSLKNNINSEPVPTFVENSKSKSILMDIQTWIYPGPPSCNAFKELSDGRRVDTVKIEFFTVSDTGTIKLLTDSEEGCNGYSMGNVSFIKQYSKYQFVTVSSDGVRMRKLFSKTDNITDAISILVAFTKKENLTGVEIDFEDFSSWTPNDYTNYKKFIIDLQASLKKDGKKLMIDTPPITKSTTQWYPFKYEDFTNIPDYISVMTYDYQFDEGVGAPIAPNFWVKEVLDFISSKVPKDKIIVGVPSYGYEGKIGSMKLDIKTKEQISKIPGYSKAVEDPQSYESSFSNSGIFYLYQTKSGLSKKVSYIQSLGYNKISVWHLGGNDWIE